MKFECLTYLRRPINKFKSLMLLKFTTVKTLVKMFYRSGKSREGDPLQEEIF